MGAGDVLSDWAVAGPGLVAVVLFGVTLRAAARQRRLAARVRSLAGPLQSARSAAEMMRILGPEFGARL